MQIRGLLTDKNPLIQALEEALGLPAVYSGPPMFKYTVGDYVVLRDGCIDTDAPDPVLLSDLAARGLIEDPFSHTATEAELVDEPPERTSMRISVPTTGLNGKALSNLIFMIAAKGCLINKAVGVPNAFAVSPCLVDVLRVENPVSLGEFMDAVYRCGGNAAVKGLQVYSDRIDFTGFPNEPEEESAYVSLSEHMVETARNARHIKSRELNVVNEKYTYRVWLNTLGLRGRIHKETRSILLKRLSGNGSFRFEEQYLAQREKLKNMPKAEPEFVLL